MHMIIMIYVSKDKLTILQTVNRRLIVQAVYLTVYVCQIDSSRLNRCTCPAMSQVPARFAILL
jgi:hypothetical protein